MGDKRYWWVNHKQTQKQEIEDGFLWSPFTKSNGSRNRFYDNMAEARPGDVVLSYASFVYYAGIVEHVATKAPKPASFGTTGANWGNMGWRLPVEWSKFPNPVSTIDSIDELRDSLPENHSPIRHSNGYGNQGCYLAEISQDLFEKVCDLGHLDPAKLHSLSEYDAIDDEDVEQQLIETAIKDGTLSDTEILQMRRSRKGQGDFRKAVFELIDRCPVTGVAQKGLLIASHVKPWRDCINLHERLDGNNGLPLSPHVDRLFDKGFITFGERGELIVSKHLDAAVVRAWGLHELVDAALVHVSPRREVYLRYHREHVFKH